jgi:hypothetical protein
MSDIYSILQSSYANNTVSTPSKGKYVAVDAKSYEGTWTGTYTKNDKKFSLQVFNVQGFRAQVKVQDSNGVSYQNVLIKDSSFRVGDTKFTLTKAGQAQVATAVTDPISGNVSVLTGTATQS